MSYWKKREYQNIKNRIANEQQQKEELKQIYLDTFTDIQEKIYYFYYRYAQEHKITMAEAMKRADKIDIQKVQDMAKEMVKNKDFGDYANEFLSLYNLKMKVSRLELLKTEISLLLDELVDEQLKYFDKEFMEQAKQKAKEQAGILGEVSATLTPEQIMVYANATFKNGSNYSKRLWENKKVLLDQLEKRIRRSITLGEHPRKLAREMAKEMGKNFNQCFTLLRTEITAVQIGQQKKSYEDNGVEYWQLVCEPDACSKCKSKAGQVYKVSDMEIGENVVMHPNCRCSSTPVLLEA